MLPVNSGSHNAHVFGLPQGLLPICSIPTFSSFFFTDNIIQNDVALIIQNKTPSKISTGGEFR